MLGTGRSSAVGEVLELGRVVGDPEVQVGLAGQQQHPRADRRQCGRQVAVVRRTGADVGDLPGAQLRVQVLGPLQPEALLPVGAQERLEVRRPERRAVQLRPVEVLAERPARVHVPERPAGRRRLAGEAAAPGVLRRRLEQAQQPGQEHPVVHAGAGGPADDDRALDLLGEQRRPVVGLDAAHGEAVDGGDPLDAEDLPQQAGLRPHVVAGRDHGGEVRLLRRAAGAPVGEHVRHDDEPARRVQHALRPDQPG